MVLGSDTHTHTNTFCHTFFAVSEISMRLSWLCGFLTVFVAWCISRWLTQESQEAVPTVWVAVLSRPSAASHRRLTRAMWSSMSCGSAKFAVCQQGRRLAVMNPLLCQCHDENLSNILSLPGFWNMKQHLPGLEFNGRIWQCKA